MITSVDIQWSYQVTMVYPPYSVAEVLCPIWGITLKEKKKHTFKNIYWILHEELY